ncbi:BMP family ABC transporter substrate-binding protein [Bacillaceae bacterium W0354]
MKKIMPILIITILLLTSCGSFFHRGQLENVGLLLEGTIHDETWGKGAYLGLLNIKDEHNVSVLFEENVVSLKTVEEAVKDFNRQGVNLIFGHGSNYGQYFKQINEYYPHIQFVYFNGSLFDKNITSIHFDGYEMGYFAGMLAALMTESNKVGVIPAYSNQSEVEGFYEGVKEINPNIQVMIRAVLDWYDQQLAKRHFYDLVQSGIDVVYPAGDSFNVPIIHEAKERNIYAIGYINDQYEVAKETVITSTVQQLDELYLNIANQYDEGALPSGVINYSFDGEYVYLGKFGDSVPEEIQTKMQAYIDQYLESGILPREK